MDFKLLMKEDYRKYDKQKYFTSWGMILIPLAVALLLAHSCFGQLTIIGHNAPRDNYELTNCSVNIKNDDNVYREVLKAYQNTIMLQSGTSLEIGTFYGTSTFIHGLKAMEELDDYVKPVLIIGKCKEDTFISVSSRIETKIDDSCGINYIEQ